MSSFLKRANISQRYPKPDVPCLLTYNLVCARFAPDDRREGSFLFFNRVLSTFLNSLLDDLVLTQSDDNINNSHLDFNTVSENIEKELYAAIDLYKQGNPQQASFKLHDIYFELFEASGFETKIGLLDMNLKQYIESYFIKINSMVTSGYNYSSLKKEVGFLVDSIKSAANLTNSKEYKSSFWLTMLSSLIIIFREGLEALLFITAVISLLIKLGQVNRIKEVKISIGLAVAASFVTAYLLEYIASNSGVNQEILEGFIILFAALMMFYISCFIFKSIRASSISNLLDNKIKVLAIKPSVFGLCFTVFLTVYREGAETIIFYKALINTSVKAGSSIFLGFVAGLSCLAIVYLSFKKVLFKFPVKKFFAITGLFVYSMAIVFAGNGMLELIEANLVKPTYIDFMPSLPLVGLYPYMETLFPQLLLVSFLLISFSFNLKKYYLLKR